MEASESHNNPYVSRDLSLPGYVPGFLSQQEIAAWYLGSSILLFSAIWLLSGRIEKITTVDRLLMCWFAFTGLSHVILDRYYVFTPEFYKVNTPQFLAEIWKEYSKGDSRYIRRDPGVVTIKILTSGLLSHACLIAVYAIARKKSYSYILQFSVSLSHLYGGLFYFVTAYLQGNNFATNEFYYWNYYIGANSLWVLIPSIIAIRAWNYVSITCQRDKMMTKNTT